MLSVVAFISCSKGDESESAINIATPSSIAISCGDTYQIEVTSSGDITYLSQSEFTAKVSADGVITANHVGSTKIVVSDGENYGSISVEIEPNVTMYDDTNLTHWGSSVSEVADLFGSNYTTGYSTDGGTLYLHYETPSTYLAMLSFAFDVTSEEQYATFCKISRSYSTTLSSFLDERYQILSYSDEDLEFYFINAYDRDDASTLLYLSPFSDDYWTLCYFDRAHIDGDSKSILLGGTQQLVEAYQQALPSAQR